MKRYNFPFDYEPKLDIKNTMLYSSTLKQLIFNYYTNKYHVIYVDPALLVTTKNSACGHANNDRTISFDNKVTNTTVSLNNVQDNYLMIQSSVLKNQNLLSYVPFIRRDAKQTNTESVFNWNIVLDLAMPKENLNIDYFCNGIKTLFGEICNITRNEELKKIFTVQTKKVRPYGFSIITLQKLEDEYPTLSIKEALRHYVAKHNFTIVINNYKKTESNQWLESPVLTAIDFELCCGLYVYDDVNDEAINIINICKRPDGKVSYNQLNAFNPIELTNNLYDERIFDKDRPTNMSVSINFTNLLYYLLDKIHLSEVVASIWPDEFIEFVKKAKIEIF